MHALSQTRTITSISSNKLLTIDSEFNQPGITTPASYKFSGKKGTGEVSVAHASTPKQVDGTSDVTQTQFQNELALGYLFMLGDDYKVVTKIESNTRLEVDTAFSAGKTYTSNDYNYESCWLSMGEEAGVKTGHRDASYTNKKVYVEDACEIKPGCCGFKNSSVPTTSSYDYKSVRESNPWALTVPQDKITCGTFAGFSANHPPNNCDYWYIGVRGDNRYPQKTD